MLSQVSVAAAAPAGHLPGGKAVLPALKPAGAAAPPEFVEPPALKPAEPEAAAAPGPALPMDAAVPALLPGALVLGFELVPTFTLFEGIAAAPSPAIAMFPDVALQTLPS